jgi:hypothetical protein
MSITQAEDRLEVITDDQPGDQDHAYDAPGAVPSPVGVRPTFTITEAAAACAVSRKTITRKLVDLAGHGAAKDDDGIWRIPVEALLALGLHPGRSVPTRSGSPEPLSNPNPSGSAARVPAATPGVGFVPAGPDMVSVPRDRWDDLRIRLARAEAEAAERALALADARLALRALTAGPTAGPGPAPTVPQGAQVAAAVDAAPPRPRDEGAADRAPAPAAAPAPGRPLDEIASARTQAARTGGYVPAAGGQPGRKRRWWQAK